MLRGFAKAAGFLAYLLITLEMLFMVTPFAFYYYSVYSPLLAVPASVPVTAWLPAFFLPHLSTEVLPSVGGLVFILGLVGFLLCAIQLYYAKFRKRGVVQRGFYRRIRHPQYLFLGIAGLGLLIVWPRFILLIVYVNMLWFYYLLAGSEERRMESRYREIYFEQKRRTWMFLPAEPGAYLQRRLFGWIHRHSARLIVAYVFSLVMAIGLAFALRNSSLRLITHLSFPEEKIAAVSFLSGDGRQLRNLIQSADAAKQVRDWTNFGDGLVLVEAMEGKRSVVHVMIDAGVTAPKARSMALSEHGVKLVFSRQKTALTEQDPFGSRARWQPALVAEIDNGKLVHVMAVDPGLFVGNPVMPTF